MSQSMSTLNIRQKLAPRPGGTMTEVTVPATHRWIPKGMTVEYLKKAETDLVAAATPMSKPDWSTPGEYRVKVAVRDEQGETVFQALITMWVTPKMS